MPDRPYVVRGFVMNGAMRNSKYDAFPAARQADTLAAACAECEDMARAADPNEDLTFERHECEGGGTFVLAFAAAGRPDSPPRVVGLYRVDPRPSMAAEAAAKDAAEFVPDAPPAPKSARRKPAPDTTPAE
jgi:hypothetical protein